MKGKLLLIIGIVGLVLWSGCLTEEESDAFFADIDRIPLVDQPCNNIGFPNMDAERFEECKVGNLNRPTDNEYEKPPFSENSEEYVPLFFACQIYYHYEIATDKIPATAEEHLENAFSNTPRFYNCSFQGMNGYCMFATNEDLSYNYYLRGFTFVWSQEGKFKSASVVEEKQQPPCGVTKEDDLSTDSFENCSETEQQKARDSLNYFENRNEETYKNLLKPLVERLKNIN